MVGRSMHVRISHHLENYTPELKWQGGFTTPRPGTGIARYLSS